MNVGPVCILWLGVVMGAVPAGATVIYQNDFEGGSAAGWSSYKGNGSSDQIGTDDNSAHHFLGLFGDWAVRGGFNSDSYFGVGNNNDTNPDQWVGDIVTLNLGERAAGSYSISYDLYIINTWDGGTDTSGNGPDRFKFEINDTQVFFNWFTKNESGPSGSATPDSGRSPFDPGLAFTPPNAGYQTVNAAAYTLTFDFVHGGGNIVFDFIGIPNQPDQTFSASGFPDEPWALDNVKVESTAPVPEPATMLLFGSGLAGLAAVRRKKSHSPS